MCTHFVRDVIVKTITRPISVQQPPDEGDWQIDTDDHVGEDA